jgi:hypothetical protein
MTLHNHSRRLAYGHRALWNLRNSASAHVQKQLSSRLRYPELYDVEKRPAGRVGQCIHADQ